MNKLIGPLATLISTADAASVMYDEEPVDCLYEANANNALCKK